MPVRKLRKDVLAMREVKHHLLATVGAFRLGLETDAEYEALQGIWAIDKYIRTAYKQPPKRKKASGKKPPAKEEPQQE